MKYSRDDSISRRDFARVALAIGGTSALAACQSAESTPEENGEENAQFPRGVEDPGKLPTHQHAWDEYLVHNAHGTTIQGQHQLILGLSYDGPDSPTEEDRSAVESAFRTLERAFQWGSGERKSGEINAGLLFMIGYAPRYLDRMGIDVDEIAGLERPESVLAEIGEEESLADPHDAIMILDSDYASVLMQAEETLFGERESVNGIAVDERLSGTFSVNERRTGFLGKGLPAERLDNDDIPENAPLSMGFRAGFTNSLPPEDTATLGDGPFEGGTTLAVSQIRSNLGEWYEKPHEDRLKGMYSPDHDREQTGEIGQRLGSHSEVTADVVDDMDEHAREEGIVGHAQKVASARDESFQTRILRRSEGVGVPDEGGGSVFNFSSIQTDVQHFVDVRLAMNTDEYDHDVPEGHHGIDHFLETISRGTFLVPTRERRALPASR